MESLLKKSAAIIACMAVALCGGGANAATKNKGQAHRSPPTPTSAAAPNSTHTPRRGSSNAVASRHIKLQNETNQAVIRWRFRNK
jgi:hypothetical protein